MSGAVVCVRNKRKITVSSKSSVIEKGREDERRGATQIIDKVASLPAHQESSISSDNYWSNPDILDHLCHSLHIGPT